MPNLSNQELQNLNQKSYLKDCEEEDFNEEVLICSENEDDFAAEDQLEPIAGVQKTTEPDPELQALITRFNPSGFAAARLISDVKAMRSCKEQEVGFRAAPKGDDLFVWEIQFFGFPRGSRMARDLQAYAKKTSRAYVELEATFPPTYPMHPPFIRVVQPRFQKGTFITSGGSICTDVLTMEAWSPSYDIQGLIMNVFSVVSTLSPRIDFEATTPYSMQAAKKAYKYTAGVHSWPLPPGY
jgi:ubiquitin-conjugating enzyme E2 Q